MAKNYIVTLLMARRQYDVANILYKNQLLDKLIIDSYYNSNRYAIFKLLDKVLPEKYKLKYQKYQPAMPQDSIISSWFVAFKFRLGLKLNRQGTYYEAQIKAYKALNNITIKYLKRNSSDNDFFGWDTASLEVLEFLTKRGSKGNKVIEQCVAPRFRQIEMYDFFQEKGVISDKSSYVSHCKALQEREEKEWRLADIILAPSPFVRESIISRGVPPEKVKLLPYGFKIRHEKSKILQYIQEKFQNPKEKKTVFFAGNAGFRKGVQDLVTIAKDFPNVNFKIAGTLESNFIVPELDNVFFLGRLQLPQLEREYKSADVFFFPSYLEGSALVTFEAMSWGLPMLTTEEAGSVAEHGVEGFITRAGSITEMKQYLENILQDDALRMKLSIASLNKAYGYGLDNYEKNLLDIIA